MSKKKSNVIPPPTATGHERWRLGHGAVAEWLGDVDSRIALGETLDDAVAFADINLLINSEVNK